MTVEGVWAYIVEEKDGSEGILAANIKGSWFPMVSSREENVRKSQPYAQAHATATGCRVRLVFFGNRRDIAVVNPDDLVEGT